MNQSGIYIHFPFCEKKCSYCDFYSIENLSKACIFTNSLLSEIELRSQRHESKPNLSSIFIGGGTPSLLPPESIGRILQSIKSHFSFGEDIEITIECNPDSTLLENLHDYRKLGINRISLGVQSFARDELISLGRLHTPEQAAAAFHSARSAGFDNIGIDLIFAVPGQSARSWSRTIDKALELGPNHISAYSLIYEKGTPLYKSLADGDVSRVRENDEVIYYETIIHRLAAGGYEHYEVSNFALSGKYCRHNLDIWHGGRYFAFGPSAHGYIGNQRYWNVRNIDEYIFLVGKGRLPVSGCEEISGFDCIAERIMLGLRADGIDPGRFQADFGIDIKSDIAGLIESLAEHNFIIPNESNIRLSKKGYLIADELIAKVVLAIEKAMN